jgi:hypothetical protein
LSFYFSIFHALCLSSLKLAMSEVNCWWFFYWFTWFSFMGHDIKRSHLNCLRGIISGLEAEECPEKSKQWLLRTDTVFLQLFFPLQEVVTMRTTLLILRRWHLGIAFRFEPVWKGKKPNRTKINRFEPVFSSVRFQNLKKIKLVWLFIWSKIGPNRKCSALSGTKSLLL